MVRFKLTLSDILFGRSIIPEKQLEVSWFKVLMFIITVKLRLNDTLNK